MTKVEYSLKSIRNTTGKSIHPKFTFSVFLGRHKVYCTEKQNNVNNSYNYMNYNFLGSLYQVKKKMDDGQEKSLLVQYDDVCRGFDLNGCDNGKFIVVKFFAPKHVFHFI